MNSERIILPAARHLADANAIQRHPAERGAWIWHPSRAVGETAILRFTLNFELAVSGTHVLHVTGDQRFQLRCDGLDVTFGPDRCDPEHWTVQSLQLELAAGAHELEALVWWLADPDSIVSRTDQTGEDPVPRPPMAQMTWRGGFLVYSDDLPASTLNTGVAPWQVADLTDTVRLFRQRIPHYFDVGPSHDFDLKSWRQSASCASVVVAAPLDENVYGVRRPGWCLHPASLSEQSRVSWSGGRIRAVRNGWGEHAFEKDEESDLGAWQSVLEGQEIEIPPHSEGTILWDFEQYRCGYPLLSTRGGTGARIEWDWAEALYEAPDSETVVTATAKGHRGEIRGKSFLGYGDRWRIAGDGKLPFLWWRSGRYVRIRFATASEPLRIEKLRILETGYPLNRLGGWTSSDTEWDSLLPIFENVYRCSAHEQWTDSPYYEQMGYVGDTLLHSLSNYVLFPDDRVTRRSLELFEWSRRGSGLVAERYPSAWRQESVTYSMLWPMMLRDYVNWRDDPAFVKTMLPGLRSVMAELEGLQKMNGLLCEAPGWPFVDWVPEWDKGCGPGVREGDSSILNLHWILCLQAAAEVEDAHGDPALAVRLRKIAAETFAAVLARYWDESRGLLLDAVDHEKASEHAQFFALLTGLLDAEKTRSCVAALGKNTDLSQATIYAAFYLLDALYRNGEEAEFHDRLKFWRGLPAQGFTATPEAPEPSRSDAHAWGAHPAWHTLASIAGIRPAAPGFRRVRIAPCPGSLEKLTCSVVHPRGVIEAAMAFSGDNLTATITLPEGISGELIWRGTRHELPPGKFTLT